MAAVFRVPTPADAVGIARLLRASWELTYAQWLTPEWFDSNPIEEWEGGWEAQLIRVEERRASGDADPVERWVAEDDGVIVGVAVAGPSRTHGAFEPVRATSLNILYVAASHHGAGVAAGLIGRALPNGTPTELWVADPNPRAQAFYRKHGFAPDGSSQINERLANIPEVRMTR